MTGPSMTGSWMKRVPRVFAVATLFAGAFAMLPTPLVESAGAAPANASVFASIGACFASQKHVLVALVMDESASLGDAATGAPGTDPTARRVTAAQVAVDGIANLTAQGTKVDVLLTGFSDDLHEYGPWQQLDSRSRRGIEGQLEGFRTRNKGLDTDFYNAMAGVQRALARQVAAMGTRSQPCELVLLFTDGRFDIDTHVAKPYDPNGSDSKAAKAARGIAALCSPAGPLQRLRNDGVRTITLALADPSAGAGQADPAFLRRLATGDCNTAGAQYGASFDAANAADLVGQFDKVATSLRGGTSVSGNCAGGQALQMAPALGSFHVFVDAGTPAADLLITPPKGRPIRITAAGGETASSQGIDLRAKATGDRFVVVEAAPAKGTSTSSARWSGRWSIAFTGSNSGASCSVSVFVTWKPRARDVTLQRGVKSTIVFEMIGQDGKPTPPDALPANARVTATITTAGASAAPVPLQVARVGKQYQAVYKLPRLFTGQTAIVTASLHLRVAGTDVVSSPGATQLRVRQSGFPSVSPSLLSLNNVTGLGDSHATITVIGDAAYSGIVCVDRVRYPTLPPIPATDLAATPHGTCAHVAPGEHSTLDFTVRVGSAGDGRVNGLLELRMTGVAGLRSETALPFTFNIARPISTTTRNKVFFVLLLAGVGAPLLILFFFGSRSAAFEILPGLRAARIRVRVFADGSIRRLEEHGATPPLTLVESDFDDAGVVTGRERSIVWQDLELRARSPRNPFSPPIGEVAVAGQYVTASDGVLRGGKRGTVGRVPLALPGTWVFALDADGSAGDDHLRAVDGTLSVFIAGGAPFIDQAPRVLQSLTQFFSQLARRIDTRVGDSGSGGRGREHTGR